MDDNNSRARGRFHSGDFRSELHKLCPGCGAEINLEDDTCEECKE